ncbi:hypothetical protein BGM19_26785 [Streptomyces agglomeratus]|nr:hypothetical protein BGM19_26785 [Streptomyces agglomeratus]
METTPAGLVCRWQQADGTQKIIIYCVSSCDGIQADDAGRLNVFILNVALLTALLDGKGFLLELGRFDQLVAPEAAEPRADCPHDAEDIRQIAVLADLDLRANLHTRDQILMHQRVEHQPGLHRVGSKKQVVAVHQGHRHIVLCDIGLERFHLYLRVRLSGNPLGNPDLRGGQPLAECPHKTRSGRIGQPDARISDLAADDPRKIGAVDPVRVDDHQMTHPEAREVFDDEGPCAAGTDNRHLLASQDGLASVTEQSALPVIGQVSGWHRHWLVTQDADRPAGEHGLVQLDTASTGKPDITGYSILGEDEAADDAFSQDVQQGWVAALVRGKIIARETDTVAAAVAMHGQVGQALFLALTDTVADEGGREHPVPPLSGDIVDTVLGEVQPTGEETHAAVRPHDAGADDAAVLITITREQMLLELRSHVR